MLRNDNRGNFFTPRNKANFKFEDGILRFISQFNVSILKNEDDDDRSELLRRESWVKLSMFHFLMVFWTRGSCRRRDEDFA